MNTYPVIVSQLQELLPDHTITASTYLRADLGMTAEKRADLATAVEQAWNIRVDDRAVADWKTIRDVSRSIAASMELEAA